MVHPLTILLLTAVSWAGSYYHTWTELALGPLRAENSLPAVVGLALFIGWWRQPGNRRLWSWLLLIWTAGAHLLVGAVLSVLPLPILPFSPEQSWSHYGSHVIYALAQTPLILVLARTLTRRREGISVEG